MADFGDQIEEIVGLLSSKNKDLAYSKLLNLQKLSVVNSSAVEALASSARSLLSSVVSDIFDSREEIADQALKCLGFMIYHPTIVASIAGDDAGVIIESVVKVIVTTKIKSVCTLGIWSISVQQFGSSLLDQHFQSLLRATVHALDNPMGSLSITFEAMQAVVKLSSSSTECMRKMSSVWVPPIYRRLISSDKRDRSMSERCLLKIMPLICPPPLTLSKALAADLKIKLLLDLKDLKDQGMKLQSLQAWGWFIRLLGPHGIKNKPLINDMLKILEQTFSDFDSQVQIASLVAWQDLIDALIELGIQAGHISITLRRDGQVMETSKSENTEAEVGRLSKRIKLIMAPLIGIISSKCEASVRASCLSTWSYLLHKLEAFASCQSVMNSVWEPILKVVFEIGPTDKNIWLWNLCLDLLDALILGRNQETVRNLHNQEIQQVSLKSSTTDSQLELWGKCPIKPYPVNFSPWKLCQLDFFIKMIFILIKEESNPIRAPQLRRLSGNAAFRLFQSLVVAVERALMDLSITHNELTQCLSTIFGFLTDVCGSVTSGEDRNYNCAHTALNFVKVVAERLEPSILGSPLYRVGLEIQINNKSESASEIRCATVPGICCIDLEERVLPVVYLSNLYFSVVVNLSAAAPEYESVLEQIDDFLKFLLTSYQPEQVLQPFVVSLYRNMFDCLQIWVVLVNRLKECIDFKSDQPRLKMEISSISYSAVLHLLSYPIASWSYLQKKLHLPFVVEAWKSLFESINQNAESINWPAQSFCENLSAILNVYFDQIALAPGTRSELQLEEKKSKGEFNLLYGNAIICLLKQLTWSINSERKHIDRDVRKSNIKNSILLASRFMNLCCADNEETETSYHSLAPRFLSELVNFARCLHRSEDVILLVETTSSSLLECLSRMHLLDANICCQVQLLWTEVLNSLQQSHPSLRFNSSFLKSQDLLLIKALDHPNPVISQATIKFWNSTYGLQNKLEFPKNLIPVLDKLYRNRKISICSTDLHIEDSISNLQRYEVTTTLKKCSKRVQIVTSPVDRPEVHVGAKRHRCELTEHQKEVRQAQQGRAMDCNGHGPSLRTYTSVDFSQGNDESQDSRDVRDGRPDLDDVEHRWLSLQHLKDGHGRGWKKV